MAPLEPVWVLQEQFPEPQFLTAQVHAKLSELQGSQADDELPEQILGTIQIRNLDVTKGRPLPT